MSKLDRILESEDEEISLEEVKSKFEAAGFLDLPSVLDLVDLINQDQRHPKGQRPVTHFYVNQLAPDVIKITLTHRGRPVMTTSLSIPGMVALLAQFKR